MSVGADCKVSYRLAGMSCHILTSSIPFSSLFDNAATGWESDEPYARGLVISLDFTGMTATLETEAIPYNKTVSQR